ncbi:hypothetical protein KVR01_006339 [Diaporthe batatas]|uniref:uncharacterized protein n=1 Tax=Diaporthe batatas TaxID=748121 RepID=UPI001D0395EF|nr:uncharacterized protein KVR01_006339 [Diaporthe batatas]KAG8164421.1 hypothetical protein KVR01_006339 [Diaporthe batatas]
MSGSHRSSKGKARARDADLEQSFSSLSMSDYGHHHAPRADCYDQSYTSPYDSSYDPTYTGHNQNYVWAAQGSYAPTPSPPATYGSTGAYSHYPATSATSSTGGYEYQSELSGAPAYSSYSAYDAASVASSSAPSYGGGGTGSVWSETESQATGASSAPSRTSHHTDVNSTINRQAAPNQVYELPCELRDLTGCNVVFPGDDEHGWMDHVESHLGSTFPSKLRCWFCNDHYFDAKQTSNGDLRYNFTSRMQHIRYHIVHEGFRPEQMLRDGHVVKHLFDHNLIDSRTYNSILTPSTVPPIPGDQGNQGNQSRQGHQSHHRSQRSYLPPVVEENVAGEGSSRSHRSSNHRSDRRSDHKKKGHERSHGPSYRRDH